MDLDIGEHTAPAVLQALINVLAAKGILSDDDLKRLQGVYQEAENNRKAHVLNIIRVLRESGIDGPMPGILPASRQ